MALRWERSYEWRPGGRLTIDQKQGTITVLGWEQPRAEVVAEFPGRDEGTPIDELLDVTDRSGGLDIEVVANGRWFGWGGNECNLTVRIPYASRVEIDNGQGHVRVEWVQGPIEIDSGQGSVILRGLGDSAVDTGQGDVHVSEHQGNLSVETGMGKIFLERVRGREIQLETGMGDVHIEGLQARRLYVEGGAGGLRLRGIAVEELQLESGMGRGEVELVSLHPRGEYELETGAGQLDLLLPPQADAELRVETGLGKVRLDLPGVQREGARGGETRVVLGRGGAKVRVESGMGAVYVGTTSAAAAGVPMGGGQPPKRTNQEELERILTLVAEGKLSPDEAEALIAALENK